MIAGTAPKVSTLLSSVGDAHSAGDGRERGLHAGNAALAFERIEQRRFFATLIGARARVRVESKSKPVPWIFLPSQPRAYASAMARVHDVDQVAILAANIDVAACANRSASPRSSCLRSAGCGSYSISRRSLQVPGSLSSALTTMYFGLGTCAGRSSTSCRSGNPRRRGRADPKSSPLRRSASGDIPAAFRNASKPPFAR